VKTGRFFRIPERPTELHGLWTKAQPLRPERLPEWLTWEVAASYRLSETVAAAGLTEAEQALLAAEIEELEFARMIVDRDPGQVRSVACLYCNSADDAVWSIGIYQGPSPLALSPRPSRSPCLPPKASPMLSLPLSPIRSCCIVAGRWHMFFEAMNWKANKGEIALATSDDGLDWRYEQIVLAEEFPSFLSSRVRRRRRHLYGARGAIRTTPCGSIGPGIPVRFAVRGQAAFGRILRRLVALHARWLVVYVCGNGPWNR